MSVNTKQFHETNFLVCHIINILLTLVGYLRELDIDLTKKNIPSTLDPRYLTLDPRQKPTLVFLEPPQNLQL